ncbi:O-antigen ligase family protein [Algoriphagus hitonicola]|uniref:O-antigen ligase n=1 Tax=Algoriphagus hitonicola TaxID=435880 RepID=A0A1I2XRJ5_9BACT|nr:O-antigen ligase family protein [Algoriphagus hitonicola]SFH16083.1 O-antigen ligase [Algoriphagus hitonicola]
MLNSIRFVISDQIRIYIILILIILGGFLGGFLGAFGIFLFSFLYLKNLRLEFLLIVFLLTFFLGDNISGFFSFANNLRFLLIGFSVVYLFQKGLLKLNFGWKIGLFTLFGLFVTALFSPLGIIALSRAVAYLLMALILFKLIDLLYRKNPFEVERLIFSFLLIFIFINSITIPFRIEGVFYLVGRFKGLMNNPNGLGLLLMFFYPILDLLQKRNNFLKPNRGSLIVKVVIFVMLFLSGSRTAMLAILIYQTSIWLFDSKRLLIPFLLVLPPLLYVVSTADLIEILSSFGFQEELRLDTLSTASGRTEVWVVAWEEVLQHPIFGQGMMYDNYFVDGYRSANIGENAARHWYGVWNSYLSLLLNVGFIGLALYLLFLFRCFQRSTDKKLAFGFLLLILSSAVTESWMAASMNAFTPLLFLYFAMQQQIIYYPIHEEYIDPLHTTDRVLDGVHAS